MTPHREIPPESDHQPNIQADSANDSGGSAPPPVPRKQKRLGNQVMTAPPLSTGFTI